MPGFSAGYFFYLLQSNSFASNTPHTHADRNTQIDKHNHQFDSFLPAIVSGGFYAVSVHHHYCSYYF
jgi:hypothetical protein